MSALNLTPAPGTYAAAQSVSFAPAAGVSYYVVGDTMAPTISEYIAYDQQATPQAFLAVTQDGKGRVVYDGGFPKYYNSTAPAPGAAFSAMSAASKFMYNAINWIANPAKVASGNKKVLVLGDTLPGADYSVKGQLKADDFYVTISRVLTAAGYTVVFKDVSDYDGFNLVPTLTELDAYCALFLFSTNRATTGLLTAPAIDAIVQFRLLGNGVFIATDDGPTASTVPTAQPLSSPGFFATANQIGLRFGAWFSGNFDRSPVSVGYIRANYGDHPLYANMLDTESIYAGISESRVVINPFTKYTAASPKPPVSVNVNGINYIRTAAKMTDGSVVAETFIYVIGTGDGFMEHMNAALTTIRGIVDSPLYEWTPRIKLQLIEAGGTMIGGVRMGDRVIGEFRSVNGGAFKYYWYCDPSLTANIGPKTRINPEKGLTMTLDLGSPFISTNVLTFNVTKAALKPRSLARSISAYGKKLYPKLTSPKAVVKALILKFGTRKQFALMKATAALSNSIETTTPTSFTILISGTSESETLAQAKANHTIEEGLIWDRTSNAMYRFGLTDWELFVGMTPALIYGVNATLISKVSGKSYFIDISGTVTPIP